MAADGEKWGGKTNWEDRMRKSSNSGEVQVASRAGASPHVDGILMAYKKKKKKKHKALKGLTEVFKGILPLKLFNLGLHLFHCVLLRSSESTSTSRQRLSAPELQLVRRAHTASRL